MPMCWALGSTHMGNFVVKKNINALSWRLKRAKFVMFPTCYIIIYVCSSHYNNICIIPLEV